VSISANAPDRHGIESTTGVATNSSHPPEWMQEAATGSCEANKKGEGSLRRVRVVLEDGDHTAVSEVPPDGIGRRVAHA
jgi:hypothetical protein